MSPGLKWPPDPVVITSTIHNNCMTSLSVFFFKTKNSNSIYIKSDPWLLLHLTIHVLQNEISGCTNALGFENVPFSQNYLSFQIFKLGRTCSVIP